MLFSYWWGYFEGQICIGNLAIKPDEKIFFHREKIVKTGRTSREKGYIKASLILSHIEYIAHLVKLNYYNLSSIYSDTNSSGHVTNI